MDDQSRSPASRRRSSPPRGPAAGASTLSRPSASTSGGVCRQARAQHDERGPSPPRTSTSTQQIDGRSRRSGSGLEIRQGLLRAAVSCASSALPPLERQIGMVGVSCARTRHRGRRGLGRRFSSGDLLSAVTPPVPVEAALEALVRLLVGREFERGRDARPGIGRRSGGLMKAPSAGFRLGRGRVVGSQSGHDEAPPDRPRRGGAIPLQPGCARAAAGIDARSRVSSEDRPQKRSDRREEPAPPPDHGQCRRGRGLARCRRQPQPQAAENGRRRAAGLAATCVAWRRRAGRSDAEDDEAHSAPHRPRASSASGRAGAAGVSAGGAVAYGSSCHSWDGSPSPARERSGHWDERCGLFARLRARLGVLVRGRAAPASVW